MACEICKKTYHPAANSDPWDPDSKPHVCNICGKGFSLKIQLKRHTLSHASGAPYICNSCEKDSENNKTYNLRLAKKGNFICDVCEKSFKTKRQLLQHGKEHQQENSKFLDECKGLYDNTAAVKSHSTIYQIRKNSQRNNKKDVQHQCSYCGKKFLYYQSFQKHCLVHEKYKCETCHNVFKSDIELDEHHQTSHCSSKQKSFSTEHCKVRFKNSPNYSLEGKEDADLSYSKKHTCDICNKSFTRKSALMGHVLTHTKDESMSEDNASSSDEFFNESSNFLEQVNKLRLPKLKIRRTYSCELCQVVCDSKVMLDQHMQSHENVSTDQHMHSEEYVSTNSNSGVQLDDTSKPLKTKVDSEKKKPKSYSCEICFETFRKKSHLRKHLQNHFEDKNIVESSSSIESLVTASGRPKKSKAYSCNTCGKKFAIERCLSKHILKHSGDNGSTLREKKGKKKPKILICHFCSEDFTGRKHQFAKHKLSHTPEVCGICDERFVDRASLREHCRVHIGTEEGRVFLECSQKALLAKNSGSAPEPKVEYIYLVLR